MPYYYIRNESSNVDMYVSDIGKYYMNIDKLIEFIVRLKKWDKKDSLLIIPLGEKCTFSYSINGDNIKVNHFDFIEVYMDEDEVILSDECEDDDYEDYDEYGYNEDDIYEDRYDERDDYDDGYGYEDESFECCDLF